MENIPSKKTDLGEISGVGVGLKGGGEGCGLRHEAVWALGTIWRFSGYQIFMFFIRTYQQNSVGS